MAALPVSVCMIAKNEEKYIEQCLKSISQYGMEIIVTDTGSTDRTKQIARKYTDKVFDFEWCSDFSIARNFCADKASNNWILVIDCDEKIQNLDTTLLVERIKQFPHFAGKIIIKNILKKDDNTGQSTDYSTDEIIRLYHKKEYEFVSPVHEQLRRIGASDDNEPLSCFDVPIDLIHYGYALSKKEMNVKQQRNLALLYRMAENEPGNAYVYFQIGQSQAIIGNYAEALREYEKSMSLDGDVTKPYVQLMLLSLAKTYSNAGYPEKALSLMEHYMPYCNTAKFTEIYAKLLWDSGQRLKSMALYLKATLMPDADTLGEGLLRCYAHLIQGYCDTGNTKMADMFQIKFAECKEAQEKQLLN